ncbi:Ras GTPase activating protein ira2, partial [Phlyctochytrium bullatum]
PVEDTAVDCSILSKFMASRRCRLMKSYSDTVTPSYSAVLVGLIAASMILERTEGRYERVLDVVVQDDLSIALALSDMAEFEERPDPAPAHSLENEVERTDYASNIFRRNSMATRLLTAFCKAKGHDFLVTTLRPVLEELLSFNPPLTFEIDPVKMSERDDSTTNHKNLKMLVNRLLDAITSNHERVPAPIRDICATISSIVGRRFPEPRVTSVGAVLFLRFICPVIVAPEGHDIVPPIQSKEVRRGLVLATKIIENLAKNVLFVTKEAFMTEWNELLRKNIARVHASLRNVSTSAQTFGSKTKLKISILSAVIADSTKSTFRSMLTTSFEWRK